MLEKNEKRLFGDTNHFLANILPLKTPLCLNTSPCTKSVHINLIRERERTLYYLVEPIKLFFLSSNFMTPKRHYYGNIGN